MYLQESMSIQDKLAILSDAAKYDVACTSSGVNRKGSGNGIGNSVACGICHSFSADGRCISLLKILFSNECIFDCKYCINRSSNDVVRTSFTPDEVCALTIDFYKRNYIEGLFLSSGIMVSPNYTMDLLYQTLYKLRNQYQFNGYIHVKAIPGADSALVEQIGWLADRMSVNLELPTTEGLKSLAPHKNRKNILKPMKQIQLRIEDWKHYGGNLLQSGIKEEKILLGNGQKDSAAIALDGTRLYESNSLTKKYAPKEQQISRGNRSPNTHHKKVAFVPAGQSTQMIIGATQENDYQLLRVAESLYDKFDLKRVFYSAYVPINEDKMLPDLFQKPPLLREHRLYQADWLLRYYGFEAEEILSEENPYFNVLLDPKCNWAMKHLECFPIEINTADYYTLLRVPGIGTKSAGRIIQARKMTQLNFRDLKKIGVVLKRAVYFITCNGKMMYSLKIEEDYITRHILELEDQLPNHLKEVNTYKQLSLFDTSNTWSLSS